jgi:anaerobic selenocysteine-containing dehydrogenase
MREERSFCRLCLGFCGVRLRLDADGRLLEVRGDKAHPMTSGYACIKGVAAPELHNGPERLLRPLKRQADGSFTPIALEAALDEIADWLAAILDRETPDSIAAYSGTQAAFTATLTPMLRGWMQGLGSKSYFTTATVDQSAKQVAIERLGSWGAGPHTWAQSDVWMFFGTNPLVSIVGGVNGFLALNPAKQIREAKARGMKLIVVDPRRTETAAQADLHLQIRPGEDTALVAGMLRLIFANGWEDRAFCAGNVAGLDDLKRAVEPFTPDEVERRTGIAPELLLQATAMFARDARRGCAYTGTGPSMSPRSNLAEHMVQNLNVVCGRFIRAGEPIANPGVVGPRPPFRAQAHSPARRYLSAPRGRVGDYSLLFGEMMSCTLADEILLAGPGQIRALLVAGANPVATLPDQHKVVEAFRGLELLVSIEPYMTSTAKLSHYILPPKLMYERPDLPLYGLERALYPAPFMQYTPAHAIPPAGSEVVDDWYVFWALARRLGFQIAFDGAPLDASRPPSNDELFAILLRDAAVSFEELRSHPAGAVFAVEQQVAAPAGVDAGRFEVAPPDVLEELAEVAAASAPAVLGPHTHLLVVRRIRETVNTLGPHLSEVRRRKRFNAVQLNPRDLAALALEPGARVEIVSEHGRIAAIVEPDETLRPGVASMAHGWGGLPDEGLDYAQSGSSPSLLIDSGVREPINAMARLSSIPVRFERPAEAPIRFNDQTVPSDRIVL